MADIARQAASSADPAATIGQAWPGLLVFLVRANRARAVPHAPTSVPVAGPGVMMALEINAAQCGGCGGGADRCRLHGDAAPEGRWALDQQDDDLSGITEFGGE